MLKHNVTQTDVLNFLIESVKNLLGIDQVNKNDDFFILGGNSLAAIDLIDLIERHYNIRLELIVLFANRTLVNLSNAIIQSISTASYQE